MVWQMVLKIIARFKPMTFLENAFPEYSWSVRFCSYIFIQGLCCPSVSLSFLTNHDVVTNGLILTKLIINDYLLLGSTFAILLRTCTFEKLHLIYKAILSFSLYCFSTILSLIFSPNMIRGGGGGGN